MAFSPLFSFYGSFSVRKEERAVLRSCVRPIMVAEVSRPEDFTSMILKPSPKKVLDTRYGLMKQALLGCPSVPAQYTTPPTRRQTNIRKRRFRTQLRLDADGGVFVSDGRHLLLYEQIRLFCLLVLMEKGGEGADTAGFGLKRSLHE